MNKKPEITAATRKRIIESFWELYKICRIDKITVNGITKKAGIHRSTFYEYFKDIYDILEQIEAELLNSITKDIETALNKNVNCSIQALSELLVTSFADNYAEKVYYLLSSNGDSAFRDKLIEALKPYFFKINNISKDNPLADYLINYIVSSMLTNLKYWYEHQDTITIQDVIVLAQKSLQSIAI